MTAENPKLSLKTLNDIEARITNNLESVKDYETIDFFLSSIGLQGTLMGVFMQNGISNYSQYIADKLNPNKPNYRAVSAISGYIKGLLNGLKNYAQSNNLIV